MSVVKEQQSLPLYQIIGAPLMALVQADVQAAQATAEFIEEMGFVTPEEPEPAAEDDSAGESEPYVEDDADVVLDSTDEDDLDEQAENASEDETAEGAESDTSEDGLESLGDLRMVTFTYEKPGADGKTAIYQVQVPLLSLVPIPVLQIKDASFEFSVNVHDAYEEPVWTTASGTSDSPHLSASRVSFRGGLSKSTSDYEMKVTLNVEQADLPIGISTLLKLMDQSVYSGSTES